MDNHTISTDGVSVASIKFGGNGYHQHKWNSAISERHATDRLDVAYGINSDH